MHTSACSFLVKCACMRGGLLIIKRSTLMVQELLVYSLLALLYQRHPLHTSIATQPNFY